MAGCPDFCLPWKYKHTATLNYHTHYSGYPHIIMQVKDTKRIMKAFLHIIMYLNDSQPSCIFLCANTGGETLSPETQFM